MYKGDVRVSEGLGWGFFFSVGLAQYLVIVGVECDSGRVVAIRYISELSFGGFYLCHSQASKHVTVKLRPIRHTLPRKG